MKKIFVAMLVLFSVSTFAKGFSPLYLEDLDEEYITDSKEIFKTLTTEVLSLKNPYCLAFNIRRSDENLDLRFATGQYIASLFFQVKTITVENHLIEVLATIVGFKTRSGDEAGSISFNCRTTNSIMEL